MQNTRLQVLQAFKQLHRTRLAVFNGDQIALEASRRKINEDFKKNKHVKNHESVEELLRLAQDVEKELRLSVIQAEETEPGKYQLNMRPDVTRLDNVPYNDCANIKSDSSRQPLCSSAEQGEKT